MISKSYDIKSQKLLYIGIALMSCVMMMYYIFGNYQNIVLMFMFTLVCIKKRIRIYLTNGDFFWLFYVLILFSFGIFRSTNQDVLIKRTVFLLMLIFLKICIQGSCNYFYDRILQPLIFMGIIHSSAVIVEYFNPFIIQNLRRRFNVESIFEAERVGVIYRGGLTPQPGVAGFTISIFLAVVFIEILKSTGKKKIIHIVLFVFGYAALILTGKRTFLVAIMLSCLVAAFLLFVVVQKRGIKLFVFVIIVTSSVLLLSRNNLFSNAIYRLLHGGLSGREGIYSFLIQNFRSSPIIGVGAEVFSNAMNIGAHNEYLRVLSENGILGFMFFLLALISPIIYEFNILTLLGMHKSYWNDRGYNSIFVILFSIFWQVFILIYSITGNPLNTIEQELSYFVFTALGIGACKEELITYNKIRV